MRKIKIYFSTYQLEQYLNDPLEKRGYNDTSLVGYLLDVALTVLLLPIRIIWCVRLGIYDKG